MHIHSSKPYLRVRGNKVHVSICVQVGIATATYSRAGSGRGSGVNFALPIDKVMKVSNLSCTWPSNLAFMT